MEPSSKMHKFVGTQCEGATDNSDLINQLPDDILHYIISFLDVFDAIGTCLVSKRWKRLFSVMPYLDFDIPKFYYRQKLSYISVETCKDFFSWVLTSRSSTNLIRFRLCCDSILKLEQIFRWIGVAASRNIQELIINFQPSEAFELPFSLVTCDSLQVLNLELSGRLLQLPNYSGFPQLKCLVFRDVELSDGDLIRNFFPGCPQLENLTLIDCILRDVRVLDISSTSIKSLSVEGEGDGYIDCDVKISCPNLMFLKYTARVPRSYLVDNLSSVEKLWIAPFFDKEKMTSKEIGHFMSKVLKVVQNIVTLRLNMGIISSLIPVLNELRCVLSPFHGLKFLKLWVRIDEDFMQVVFLLLKHSPNLEALSLYCDEKNF